MKKASIIIHQNYIETVVKNLHETGLMEIIEISKEDLNLEAESKNDLINFKFDTCTSYKDRLSKLINILTKVTHKKKGIKAILYPDLPKIKIVEDKTLDEMYSYAEGFLKGIEKDILEDEQKLHKLEEEIKKINLNIQQLNYIKDFNIDVLDICESKYIVIKAGKTNDIKSIRTQIEGLEKSLIYSKQFDTGKKTEWAVILTAYISEKEIIEKIFRENVSEFNFQGLSGFPKDILKSLEKEK